MGAPYSLDLRIRVVSAAADGISCVDSGALSGQPLLGDPLDQAPGRDGQPGGAADGGKKPFALADEEVWIREWVAEKPDITGRVNARGVDVSYYGVWRFLDHAGLSFKESLRASEQDRADVARRRRQWQERQGKVCATRLIFIDETWAKTNMTRLHGRCARGQCLVAKVPNGQRTTLTFLAGLRCDGITAPRILLGPINAESFLALGGAVPGPNPAAWRHRGDGQSQQP